MKTLYYTCLGVDGPSGSIGAPGLDGDIGIPGRDGDKGDAGSIGGVGPTGVPGSKGSNGKIFNNYFITKFNTDSFLIIKHNIVYSSIINTQFQRLI